MTHSSLEAVEPRNEMKLQFLLLRQSETYDQKEKQRHCGLDRQGGRQNGTEEEENPTAERSEEPQILANYKLGK